MGKALSMKATLVVALALAMLATGCSPAWVVTLDSILAAAAPPLIKIFQIVAWGQGQPIKNNLGAKLNDDPAAIKPLAADFTKASSGSAPGICQELQAGVNAYEADQQLVLQVAQGRAPSTQTK